MSSPVDLGLIIVIAPIAWIVWSIQNERQHTERNAHLERRIRKRQAAQRKTQS